jgi:hypothetical protein
VEVRGCGIKSRFDLEWFTPLQLFYQQIFGQYFLRTSLDEF